MFIQDERSLTRCVVNDPNILAIFVDSVSEFAKAYRLSPPRGNPREFAYTVESIQVLRGSVPNGSFIAKYRGGKVRMFTHCRKSMQIMDGYNTLMARKGKLYSIE